MDEMVLPFRDLLVAASLKLVDDAEVVPGLLDFPRSFGRGLIEARDPHHPPDFLNVLSAIFWSRPH